MANRLKKSIYRFITGANVVTILLMLLVGYAGCLDPARHPNISNLGLIFPLVVLVNLVFLVVWAIVRFRNVWIPILGFIVCIGPLRAYCPLNFGSKDTENALKIVSYNVQMYSNWDKEDDINPINRYLTDEKADIVCIQEITEWEPRQKAVLKQLRPTYPYIEILTVGTGSVCMAVASRHPILSTHIIPIPSRSNMSAAVRIKVGNDTVTVINNHLETVGFSVSEKEDFEQIVKGTSRGDTATTKSKLLFHKIAETSKIRSKQVKVIKDYILNHQSEPIICCGDLNADPLSYTRRTLGKLLTDCYIATATGPGWSFYANRIFVRIDNVFCSEHFQPVACTIDKRHKYSDHYPIVCYLKWK